MVVNERPPGLYSAWEVSSKIGRYHKCSKDLFSIRKKRIQKKSFAGRGGGGGGEDYYYAVSVCVSVAIAVVGVVDTAAVAAIVCRRFFLLGQIRVPLQPRAFQAP